MKVTLAFTLLSSLSAFSTVLAAPTANAESTLSGHANNLFKRKECPADVAGISRGSCNGTSCRWGGINFPCVHGSCVGNGGGDGSCCFFRDNDGVCPNGGW